LSNKENFYSMYVASLDDKSKCVSNIREPRSLEVLLRVVLWTKTAQFKGKTLKTSAENSKNGDSSSLQNGDITKAAVNHVSGCFV